MVNPEKARVVKKAFVTFANQSVSFTQIANQLHRGGVTRVKNGKPVNINQVKKMLGNTFYIGILFYGGEYYQASHKCFITKDLFNKVQKKLKRLNRPREYGHCLGHDTYGTTID